MADITNIKQLNYSAEEINVLLDKVKNIENTISSKVNEALTQYKAYTKIVNIISKLITANQFGNDYTPKGTYTYQDTNISVSYTNEKTSEEIMEDLSMLLGSLHNEGVSTVKYKETEYVWNSEGGLPGSNFATSDGVTLIDTVTSDYVQTPEEPISFELDGILITYTVTQEV